MPDEAYGKRSSTERVQATREQREEKRDPHALIAALKQQVAALEKRLASLDDFLKGLNGQGGIDVTGNTITLNKKFKVTAKHTCGDDGSSIFEFNIQ